MASVQHKGSHVRRRSKTHGWFDHGDSTLFPQHVRFVDDPGKPAITRPSGSKRVYSHSPALTWYTLAVLAIFLPAIILSTISLRGLQLLCDNNLLSQSTKVCSYARTKPKHSLLQDLPSGKTPMTTTIDRLTALNEISPSLEFLGLPLFTVNTNLSTLLHELENNLNVTQLESLQSGNIGNAAVKAHELVERFSGEDHEFRTQTVIWKPHGLANLSEAVGDLKETIGAQNNLWLSSREMLCNTVPLLSRQSLSYKLRAGYHQFVLHHSASVEDLVLSATETKLSLQIFLGHIGNLETQLAKLDRSHTDRLVQVRHSTAWALKVVGLAGEHYKTIYSSLQTLSRPLAQEVACHDSCLQPSISLSVTKLRELVVLESGQISELSAKSLHMEEVMDKVYEEYMRGEDAQKKIGSKIESAAKDGRVEWL